MRITSIDVSILFRARPPVIKMIVAGAGAIMKVG